MGAASKPRLRISATCEASVRSTTSCPLLRSLRGERRERRLNAIVVATDLLVWKVLRLDMRLAREQAERVVVEMVGAVVAE